MFRRITIFLTVAKHLSYTKAAEELYMSQPAVTKNIKELEHEWGVRLFNRNGNRISLTAAGKIACQRASDINRQLTNLEYDLSSMYGAPSGILKLGASSTIAQYVIPPLIAQFKKENADVKFLLISGNTTEINEKLHNDYIDLAITEGKRKINDFKYQSFIKDEIALISRAENPPTIPTEIAVADLHSIPLAIRETGSGTREVFVSALKKMQLTLADLTIHLSLGSTESIKSYVLQSDVAGVFSTSALQGKQRNAFEITRITDHPIKRTFMFATKQGDKHNLATKFIRFGKRHYNLNE